jgi:hypothetical protein
MIQTHQHLGGDGGWSRRAIALAELAAGLRGRPAGEVE